MSTNYSPGLAGIIAAQTALSSVDGQKGELLLAGYPVEGLAGKVSVEEMMALMWRDHLPNATELGDLTRQLSAQRTLAPITMQVLQAAAGRGENPMDALRMAAGTLSVGNDAVEHQAVQITAQVPVIVASYWRLLQDQSLVAPRSDLGHAANFLYMLNGTPADDAQVRGLETYLNTVVDHGLNASTFAARVIISTGSDLVSAVVGAIGALKGPLHGGAPGPALDMVFEIEQMWGGDPAKAEAYLREKLARKERLMGFGHRIYRVRDPRAEVLAQAAELLFQRSGDMHLYDTVKQIEQIALKVLAEHKPDYPLQTNVEFYTALLLHGLGLPVALFSPVFAVGRVVGWLAHCIEQQRTGRIIRPESQYVGERGRMWKPVAER